MKGNIFIKRPVMAMSIAIMILLVGAISYFTLPLESYPDIAPPTVQVSATYTGASADAVSHAVIQPLEESINGVENMTYMTSTATNSGSATITIYFKQGTNADMCAVNVQNRVSKAQGLLPQEVTRIGVMTQKRQTSFLQIDALECTNGEYDEDFISNYLDINVIPQIKRIKGVGDVMELGGTYSLRIWMDPAKMAQYGLIPADISAALAEQNLESPTGLLGENPVNGTHGEGIDNPFSFTMKYTGRLASIDQFENIVLKALPDGNVLKLKDVAKAELGAVSYSFHGGANGHEAVCFLAFQVAGANAKETNDLIFDKLDELSKDLPDGLKFTTLQCSNDFLMASIANVEETLIVAIILVILVVYFFLQDFRATIIPSISIIVSLVGTFACLSVAGFSLNLLTLFALVLAIGTVVDDAIVVVEAVQAKFDAGYTSPYEATKDAMNDVTMAVISCTFVFMAVFIPVSFMPGTSGIFYTQFGVTLATSVGLSCVSALTLCPALCALMMRPASEERRKGFFGQINYRTRLAYEATYGVLLEKYLNVLKHIVSRKARIYAQLTVILAFVGVYFAFKNLSSGLVPQEDQGTMMMVVNGVPGANLANTNEVLDRVEKIVKDLPEVESYNRVAGYSFMAGQGTAYAMCIMKMKNWTDRRSAGPWNWISNFMSTSTVASGMLTKRLMEEIPDAQCLVFEPGMIPGYGMGSIELNLQDKNGGDKATFLSYTQEFLNRVSQHPEVMRAMTSYARNFPQLLVEVDAAQCKRAGISPSLVLSTLGSYCGGAYVSNMNQFGHVYRVMLQATEKSRLTQEDLSNMYVRNDADMAPISEFIKLTPMLGPEIDTRFNLFSSIMCNLMPNAGYSSTDVMRVVEEEFHKTFPSGFGYEYGGISREENEMRGSYATMVIYCVCAFLIFLILSCLYESFLVPWSVILSVPAGVLGSVGFAWLWNQGYAILPMVFGCKIDNNIYLQTGIIMLIGLLSKTAILITEFALERRRKGMGIVEAAYAACEARLRPILMTVLTMIIGMVPLMVSTGAGSHSNRTIGVTVIGGMFVGTLAILFTVPVFFILTEWLQEKIRPVMVEEADQQFLKEREHSLKAKKEAEAEHED